MTLPIWLVEIGEVFVMGDTQWIWSEHVITGHVFHLGCAARNGTDNRDFRFFKEFRHAEHTFSIQMYCD